MSRIPLKNPEIFFRVGTNDTIVLMDISEDEFFWEINGVAADLWKAIDGKKSWAEIKASCADTCELEADEFEASADELLESLVSKKLVTLV